MILIDSKRKKLENILKKHPDAIIADVTSHAKDSLIKLSPFYPHGGIPVPFSNGVTATCVEAIWQGLKVFEGADVDVQMFQNDTMKNIKRTVRKFGKPLGHRKGVNGTELLNYIEARKLIYIPTYKWVLENKVQGIIARLREASKTKTIVLLDYNTNCDVNDPKKPLSHAFLIKAYVEGLYPFGDKKWKPQTIESKQSGNSQLLKTAETLRFNFKNDVIDKLIQAPDNQLTFEEYLKGLYHQEVIDMDDFTIVGCMNRKNMENETLKERFLGTIFGQAVGDALGLSTEFMSKQEVDRFYPTGIEDYSQIVQDDHRRRWQRGDWTDDTDMMLCILDSFVACQKVDVLDIARRFKEWMMNGGMGIGRHTYNVMALGDYTSNPQKAAEIIWKMGKKKAAANGAVMRTSVVGLMKGNVTSNAENICRLTHFDPRCVGSCVIVSSIIHALVFEDRILDYENVIGIAKQYDERIVPFIDLAYHEGLDSLCLDDEKSMGYTLRTLGAALWAYWHATSYKEGILKIVLSGGDADTNAAVAGAILGAKFGICHIPEEWRNGLLHASMLHDKVQKFYAMYR